MVQFFFHFYVDTEFINEHLIKQTDILVIKDLAYDAKAKTFFRKAKVKDIKNFSRPRPRPHNYLKANINAN